MEKGKAAKVPNMNKKTKGKFNTTGDGKPLCFDWNNGRCNDKNCPNNREHACQKCRGQHRAKNCPKKKGGGAETADDNKDM